VQNWIPTYLETAKGFSFHQSSAAWFMFEYAAIPGTLLCGWVSDRIFGGRRGPATILIFSDDAEAVLARHDHDRFPLESALARRATLEDVFLKLTGRSLRE
jgi:hypothetical protein